MDMLISSNNKINIAFSTDENYSKYCIVAITSIKETQKDFEMINVFVLTKNLSAKTQKRFENLNTENFKVKLVDTSNIDVSNLQINLPRERVLPASAYYRLLAADILQDYDKLLYLDCDIIVKDSLLNLWGIDTSNYFFAAVKDISGEFFLKDMNAPERKKSYFNSGVLLMNLKKWREENGLERCKGFVRNPYIKPRFNDQDILNFSFEDDEILFIDKKWNFQQYFPKEDFKECAIIHYITENKPWDLFKIKVNYRDYYWKNLKKTVFKNEIYSYYFAYIVISILQTSYKIFYREIKRAINKMLKKHRTR